MICYSENRELAEMAIARLTARRNERAGWLTELHSALTEIADGAPPTWETMAAFLGITPELGDLTDYPTVQAIADAMVAAKRSEIVNRLTAIFLDARNQNFPLAPGKSWEEVVAVPAIVLRACDLVFKIDRIESPERYIDAKGTALKFKAPAATVEEKTAIFEREKRYISNEETRAAIDFAAGLAAALNVRTHKTNQQTTPGDLPVFFKPLLTHYHAREFDKDDTSTTPGHWRNPFLWMPNMDIFYAAHPAQTYIAMDEHDVQRFTPPTSGEFLQMKQARREREAQERQRQIAAQKAKNNLRSTPQPHVHVTGTDFGVLG